MLHEAMRRNEVIKTQYVPFQPVTCLDSMLGMITNGVLSGPYLYICGRACATVSRCTSNIFGCRGNSVGEAGLQSRRRSPAPCAHVRAQASHALKLVDALFGVAGADLSEGLVLVPSGFHVLGVDDVVDRLLALVASVGQLRAQSLGTHSEANICEGCKLICHLFYTRVNTLCEVGGQRCNRKFIVTVSKLLLGRGQYFVDFFPKALLLIFQRGI